MFAFKALLDAKVNRNRQSLNLKLMKKFTITSQRMISRKKDYLNENVVKVDCMVNSRDHPIEIEDDEVSKGKKFIYDEVKKENDESPIEIYSSNSRNKTIDISSSNSWKKKKPRNNISQSDYSSMKKRKHGLFGRLNSKSSDLEDYVSDSDYEVRSITRSRKLVNRSVRKFSSDSDFEDGSSSSVKMVDNIADKKVKKKMELHSDKIKSLYSRVSLHSIYGVVKSMNHKQKECVRSLGFGSLIDMKTQSIPTKLCYFVVDLFDPLEMVIKTEVSNILVTREDVNRVLGLPMGVDQLNSVDLRGNEEWYEIWKYQFKKSLSLITPNDVVYKIIERCEADMVFVANFIILFLYVDRIQCRQMLMVRRYPVINNWTLEQLKVREMNEISNRGFGRPSTTVESVDEVSRGSILVKSYGLKLKELCSAFKAFRHSNYKCEYAFQSSGKSSSCDDKSNEFRDVGQSINNIVGGNKYGSANLFGKSGNMETKLHVDCEGGHKEKCIVEGIPSFNLGIDDDMHTPPKVSPGVVVNKYGTANLFGKSGFIETKLPLDCEGGHKEKCVVESIPSINLGIEDDMYTPPKVNPGIDSYVHNNYVSVGIGSDSVKRNEPKSCDESEKVKILEKDMISSRPKRSHTLPPVLRSPFVVRAIKIDSNLTKEENIKSNWLFSLCGNPMDDLFHSINGQRGERYMFESLYPGEFLFSGTIDCFVEVLNYDERARNLDTPSCFFFKTAVLDPAYMHSEACKYDDVYENFKENVFHCLGESKKRRNLKGIDLVFFPACANSHYFVFVFYFKNRKAVILDNILYRSSEKPYPHLIQNLKYMFGRYLQDIKHFMAFSVMYEMEFVDQYMTWKTRGGPLAQWRCGFKMESFEQILQLRNLRRRYSMKILLSEVNLMKNEVEQLLVDYQKLYSNDRRVMYHEGIINIAARLAAFGP
ncbi:unnamed protein product [Lactuca saligna]|uniref:Ubiquitin-like protease family profile domain-containing protein n=1 Tax=Lactuca saligna TaxID=75948 RepID=A0AA35V4R0_LACSI|nr:unnamed protein product [Lactuca saligna]